MTLVAAKQIGSIYSIEDGKRFRGVMYVKDEFQVSHRKTFTATTEKALKKRMKEHDEAVKAGRPTDGMKVELMCELAITACETRGCSPKTLKGYRDLLKVHVRPTIGSIKISELKPAQRRLGA